MPLGPAVPSIARITAKTGPNSSVSNLRLHSVRELHLLLDGKSVMFLTEGNGRTREFDIQNISNLTITISNGVASVILG